MNTALSVTQGPKGRHMPPFVNQHFYAGLARKSVVVPSGLVLLQVAKATVHLTLHDRPRERKQYNGNRQHVGEPTKPSYKRCKCQCQTP